MEIALAMTPMAPIVAPKQNMISMTRVKQLSGIPEVRLKVHRFSSSIIAAAHLYQGGQP